ncbi:unnamed protein product [Leuciscus chuanchicus]
MNKCKCKCKERPAERHCALPLQRLFSRRARTLMPMHDNLLQPEVIHSRQGQIENRNRQAVYYNRHVQDLDPLKEGDRVHVQPGEPNKTCRKATVVKPVDYRSYDVQLDSGNILRRNRRHLRKEKATVMEQTETRQPAEVHRDRVTAPGQSCVRINGRDSDWFPISSGVRQGCVAAPDLFNCIIDHLMSRVCERVPGVSFGSYHLTDLEYADDTILLSTSYSQLRDALGIYSEEAEKLGLQVSWTKTKFIDRQRGPKTRDYPQKSPGCVSPAVPLETTLAAPDHLTQDEAPDLQLSSTLHPALWLGDLALK